MSAKSPSDSILSPSPITSPSSPSAPPSSVDCPICGRMFGKKSIKIHEPQCRKKWEQRNEALPPGKRQTYPPKQVTTPARTPEPESSQNEKPERSTSPKRPAMVPCYLCGRMFSGSSLYIHEPQCLKKWRMENEKLPPNKRRKEPTKPDIVFKPSGSVDCIKTFHRIWDNHLAELVECRICGRSFFPDRIEKHETVCVGNRIQVKKKK